MIIIIIINVVFVAVSMMILILGFTCPPTIHFKFITKCDSFVLSSFVIIVAHYIVIPIALGDKIVALFDTFRTL